MTRMKGYITYPMNTEIRALLLNDHIVNGVKIKLNGKLFESRRTIPSEILKDLEAQGAIIEHIEKIAYNGKANVFNIYGTKSQTVSLNGDKYIRVRVIGDTLEELMTKISEVKKKMEIYGIQPKICVWDRVGKLKARPVVQAVAEPPKITVNFDPEDIKRRRDLELQTARQN